MKVKISVIVMEGNDSVSPMSRDFFSILVDESYNIPSKYISTKTIEETIQEIYDSICHLDVRFASPILKDVRSHKGELEILYYSLIPAGIAGLKSGLLIPPYQLELESFYGQTIIEQPRSVSQRY